jgi:hypothetical protein
MPWRYEATASISSSVSLDAIVRIIEFGSVARAPDL